MSKQTSEKWQDEIIMKPIQELAEDLEHEGRTVVWGSEVEAFTFAPGTAPRIGGDLVNLIQGLAVRLQMVGKYYMGLCPFHDDHQESLAVDRERSHWRCYSTRCGKSSYWVDFLREWQQRGPRN